MRFLLYDSSRLGSSACRNTPFTYIQAGSLVDPLRQDLQNPTKMLRQVNGNHSSTKRLVLLTPIWSDPQCSNQNLTNCPQPRISKSIT